MLKAFNKDDLAAIIRFALPISAPTGHHVSAKGNALVILADKKINSPERAA